MAGDMKPGKARWCEWVVYPSPYFRYLCARVFMPARVVRDGGEGNLISLIAFLDSPKKVGIHVLAQGMPKRGYVFC
jgi:hypothetical protein